MKPRVFTLVTAICSLVLSPAGRLAAAAPDPSGEYRIVEGSRPDGSGKYRGKVSIEKAGSSAFTVNWALDSGESYHGPALFVNGVLGAGFGDALTGLAVYEIKGRTLKAKWLLPATPQTVGEYELSGPGTLNGFYKFTNGLAGGVAFKPNGKIYDVVFSLPTGNVSGIAVRVGDVLIAASGNPGGKGYGLAAYHAAGNKVEGVWTVSGQNGLGIENLGPGGSDQAPAEMAATAPAGGGGGTAGFNAAGTEVRFAGDTYQLKDSQSAPGRPTSELREYLRAGETFDQYPKMFALRVQEGQGADPLTFTRAVLATVKKDTPSADTSEIAHDDNSATMEFLLVNGNDVEYNFWHYFRVAQGRLASVQFVLRNKPPYETKDKFKAERKAHLEDWMRDARSLAPQVPEALARTTKVSAGAQTAEAPPPAEKKPNASDDALAEKIGVDLRTAGGIAGNFLGLLQAGKLPEAAALVSDEGLSQMKTTRRDFLARLQREQAADGRMVSFAPDKNKLDFGAEAGGMYFILVADSKCEKTPAAIETLRFFRFPDGKVKMVNYQRSSGGANR